MTITEIIEQKLTKAFDPVSLTVMDESEEHRGHAGFKEGGETHFRVEISASAFNGLSRVAQQRAIYKVLETEMAGRIHALALKVEGVAA